MKLFQKSKKYLTDVRDNSILFFQLLKETQKRYFALLMKKKKTDQESIEFRNLRNENLKLCVFVIFMLTPLPFMSVAYFIVTPKFLWPISLKTVLKQ